MKRQFTISAEPEDYYIYFDVDMETGIVNKTHRMNASENGKYVLFVKVVLVLFV